MRHLVESQPTRAELNKRPEGCGHRSLAYVPAVPEAVGVEATGAEQLRLVAQGGQVAEAVATIGSITARSRSTAASGWRRSPAARQPSALVSLTRSVNSRSNAAPACPDHTDAIGGDFEAGPRA